MGHLFGLSLVSRVTFAFLLLAFPLKTGRMNSYRFPYSFSSIKLMKITVPLNNSVLHQILDFKTCITITIIMYYYYFAVTCHKMRHMLKINSFSHWTILAHLIHRLIPLWKILMYVLLFSYIYQQYHQIFSCSMLKLLNTFSLSNGEVWTLLF